MVALGLGLETAKVLTFRMGKGYRAIALALLSISILASIGSALIVIDADRTALNDAELASLQGSEHYHLALAGINAIDQEITVLVGRQEALPTTYVTASRDIGSRLAALHQSRSVALAALGSSTTNADRPPEGHLAMFVVLSRVLGIQEDLFLLLVLGALAVLLEASILALGRRQDGSVLPAPQRGHICPKPRGSESGPKASERPELGPEALSLKECVAADPMASRDVSQVDDRILGFLAAMVDPESYPVLRGRDVTAQKLGVGPYQAKLLVKDLAQRRLITVEGRRLVLRPEGAAFLKEASPA